MQMLPKSKSETKFCFLLSFRVLALSCLFSTHISSQQPPKSTQFIAPVAIVSNAIEIYYTEQKSKSHTMWSLTQTGNYSEIQRSGRGVRVESGVHLNSFYHQAWFPLSARERLYFIHGLFSCFVVYYLCWFLCMFFLRYCWIFVPSSICPHPLSKPFDLKFIRAGHGGTRL